MLLDADKDAEAQIPAIISAAEVPNNNNSPDKRRSSLSLGSLLTWIQPEEEENQTASSDVDVVDVVLDAAPYPFTRANFRAFLERERAEENLDYLLDVLLFRQIMLGEALTTRDGRSGWLDPMSHGIHPGLVARYHRSCSTDQTPRSSMLSAFHVASSRASLSASRTHHYHHPGPWGDDDSGLLDGRPPTGWSWAMSIISKYIGPNATVAQVNLSEKMNAELLQWLEELGAEACMSDAQYPDFSPSAREVWTMLGAGDRWLRFCRVVRTTNITRDEAKFRLYSGITVLLVATLFGLLLRYVAPPSQFPRYALALVLFPGALIGSSMIVSSRTHICLSRASRGIGMPLDTDWWRAHGLRPFVFSFEPILSGTACDIRVEDSRTLQVIRRRANRDLCIVFICSVILCVLIAATPPFPA